MNQLATYLRSLLAVMAALVMMQAVAGAQCLPGWQYQVPITIDNSTNPSALTNYQVAVMVNTQALISAGKMRSDGNDIRFTDASCTSLAYWIESGINTMTTKIWVKVPSIGANSTASIKLIYGNAGAAPGSDGNATFELFDDFDGAALDAAKWTESGTGTSTVAGGAISFSTIGNSDGDRTIRSNASIATPIVTEMKVDTSSINWPNLAQLLPSTRNGYSIARQGSLMWMVTNVPTICSSYGWTSAVSRGGNTTEFVGIWSLAWGATGSQNLAWPNRTQTESSMTHTLGSSVDVGLGLFCSGAGTMRTDWVRARKYTTVEPRSILGAEATNCIVNWGWRVPITITNTGGALTDMQVAMTINTAALVTAGKMNSSGNDIRFADGDCCTPLPYWIESDMNTASTKIWVRVPSVPNGTKTIDLYYGNSTASAGSNGNTTFPLFDDFDGTTLDAAKWTALGGGTSTVSGGAISFSTTNIDRLIRSNAGLTTPVVAEMKVNSATGNWPHMAQLPVAGFNGYSLVYSGAASAPFSANSISLAGTFFGCGSYGAGPPISSVVAAGLTGVWVLGWGATGSQRASWPGGAISSNSTFNTLPGSINVALGMMCAGTGSMSVDWARARKYAATEPTTVAGAEVALTRPSIGTQPTSQQVCFGSSATFSVGATGTGLSYQWRMNGIDMPGKTSSSLTINPTTEADAGSYSVAVRGSNCTETISNSVTLSFHRPTLTVTLSPNSIRYQVGKMRTIYATVTPGGVCTPLTTVLESITSNEPLGANDIQYASFNTSPPDVNFNLAANRSGAGSGRVYTVTYRVTDAGGSITRTSATVTVPITGGMKAVAGEESEISGDLNLEQNVPNPFSATTEIAFTMPIAGRATVKVYDLDGRQVATLVDAELGAGRQTVIWDGRGAYGAHLPSGVYYYRVEASGLTQGRSMMILR